MKALALALCLLLAGCAAILDQVLPLVFQIPQSDALEDNPENREVYP